MLSMASVRYQLFVFRSIFLQTSCFLVGSPRELYPQVLKKIINDFLLYINVIISYPLRVCKNESHHVDEGRHLYLSLRKFRVQPLQLAEPCHVVWAPYHVVWVLQSFNHSAALKHGIRVNIASFVYTIQMPICYVGCLMITNTWTYISLYIRNTPILENKKSVYIFPHQLVNTCDLHLFRLLKCAICSTIQVQMPPIGQFEKFFKVY